MSIKLKKKYDYISTSDGKIIPISSIISIEIYKPTRYSNPMYNTYKIYYNKQILYKQPDSYYGLSNNNTDFKLKYDFIELNYDQYQDFLKHFKNKIYNIKDVQKLSSVTQDQ